MKETPFHLFGCILHSRLVSLQSVQLSRKCGFICYKKFIGALQLLHLIGQWLQPIAQLIVVFLRSTADKQE